MERRLTVQDLDPDSVRWIEREAKRRGIPPEDLVVQLIRRGIDLEQARSELTQHHDLDSLAGTWDDADTEQFLQAISDFEKIDEELWD